jgi:hypothetical protein
MSMMQQHGCNQERGIGDAVDRPHLQTIVGRR